MDNLYQCKVIFGGLTKANKRDKTTGAKLAEEYAKVNILEIDTENNCVNMTPFYISVEEYEKYADRELELLKPCLATISFSVTSMYKKLVDLMPIQNKTQLKTDIK